MLDKEQLFNDINQMSYPQRYAHVMSAMQILFDKPDDADMKRNALLIARTHLKLFNKLTKQNTKL